MTTPTIHGINSVVSASAVREALGDSLSRIRQEDRLTWSDIGAVIGKSEDQAAKYADGTAEMGVVSYYRAKAAWNGRFTGCADKMVGDASDTVTAHQTQSRVLHAALALSLALEDGELSDAEIRANRSTLENARDAIDGLLSRLTPRVA
jgi:hypothetical protein